LEVPFEGVANGDSVVVYFSEDNINWSFLTNATVTNDKITFTTNHLSYFAIARLPVEESVFTLHYAAQKTVEEVNFLDIKDHWAESYINTIAEQGIVSGKTPTSFAPDVYITRAELTKMAINAFGFTLPTVATGKSFADVELDQWYAPYIQVAKENGIVQGYGADFRPNQPINRVEALKILLVIAQLDSDNTTTTDFSDTEDGAWYIKYVNAAQENGIVSGYGDGTFRPGNYITRAEVAKIVAKVLGQ
jgi:hypothetical protein